MPQPTTSDVHVDAALTSVSVAYVQDQMNFIADKVFPVVPVEFKSDKYFVYDKNDFFRDEAKKRAPGTESAGGGYDLTTATYSADVWAWHKDIDDQTRSNTDPAQDPDADATKFVTQVLLIRKERNWASNYFTTGIWGTDVVGTTDFTKWDDEAASDPVEDIKVGRVTILKSTGFEANTLVFGYEVFEALKKHPIVVDRFKHTSSNSITADMLARLFEVERVLVAKSVYATNVEGATAAYDFIQGKNALLCHVTPTPNLMVPTAGYTMAWRNFTGLNNAGIKVKNFRMEPLESDRIEGQMAFDQKLVASDMGYFFSAAVS